MDRTVADLNIAHFKKLLEAETDAEKRQIIRRLLQDEEQKLAANVDPTVTRSGSKSSNRSD